MDGLDSEKFKAHFHLHILLIYSFQILEESINFKSLKEIDNNEFDDKILFKVFILGNMWMISFQRNFTKTII